MRIAVIADTHDRYPPGLPERLKDADEIWHLGDVCDPVTLIEFELLGPRLFVVLGNNDEPQRWPSFLKLEREKVTFHLIHIPPPRIPLGCHAVLHGHTHVPRDEVVNGVRFLNPGCITRPARGIGPTFAWMTVKKGQIAQWEIVSV